MDPSANLTEQLKIAARIQAANVTDDDCLVNDAERLADLVLALDEWICKGGFLPERWTRK